MDVENRGVHTYPAEKDILRKLPRKEKTEARKKLQESFSSLIHIQDVYLCLSISIYPHSYIYILI